MAPCLVSLVPAAICMVAWCYQATLRVNANSHGHMEDVDGHTLRQTWAPTAMEQIAICRQKTHAKQGSWHAKLHMGPALIADSARALMGWSVGTKVGR